MAIKKRHSRPTAKRRRAPVTAQGPLGPSVTKASSVATSDLTSSVFQHADPLLALKLLTPKDAETTSTTSSLLAVKGSQSASRQKSSLATAQLIRRYHTLNKELSKCLTKLNNNAGNGTKSELSIARRSTPDQTAKELSRIAEIRKEMDDLGGLDMYQKASTLGQSKQRGGDSSKWLIPVLESCRPNMNKKTDPPLRLLDVGALSPHNYKRYSSWITTTPIDLNPQDPLITKMDFLEMPIPPKQDQLFDIVCLSLVVNFVGDPAQRGEILRRSAKFLVPGTGILFLVLPLPCIQNSRYMDHELLMEMMASLGYTTLVNHHFAKKLVYYAFQLDRGPGSSLKKVQPFSKKLRHDKPNRNK
ncbi:hypothetical protein BGW38_000481 [Lunasporangiospora selenospora]|uniref:25S rRNA adenine-N(1) methyltransferase n=1 Tax=Lunasporangiospora selenospora TaxID=979761 RepID=A0A9P6G412_9FUNG|nr:hypothetical protein BGW38_000481 [Lunasporangiospora selenospora]